MADIEIACPHCEQGLEVPEEMIGENVECPACSKAFQLDATEDEAPAPAEGDAETCPSCNAALEPGTVLCVHCGYHQKLGRRIQTDFG